MDNYERRGSDGWIVLIIPIFLMGVYLIALIVRDTCGLGAPC